MKAATQFPVLTVGHSNLSPEAFLALLHRHGVTAVADVRSKPYSRYTPHFNHDILQHILEAQNIEYVYMGQELGGRPADRSYYDDGGRVMYDLLATSDAFDDGIRRVVHRADEGRVVLMCTEKEPLDCHRTLLVAGALSARGVQVEHILADGSLEAHDTTMDRLVDEDRKEGDPGLYPNGDMFRSKGRGHCRGPGSPSCQHCFQECRLLSPPSAVGDHTVNLYTIGFTQKPARTFFALLRESGARRLVDVRLNSGGQLSGFAKAEDLIFFLRELCSMDYAHMPELAPTREMLDAYRKGHRHWPTYEREFLALMEERRIADTVDRESLSDAVLLCSENTPDRCHRRLVAEHLQQSWEEVNVFPFGVGVTAARFTWQCCCEARILLQSL